MVNRKRTMFVLLVAVMLVILAACSKSEGNNNQAQPSAKTTTGNNESKGNDSNAGSDSYVLGEEPLQFSFYGHYDWYTMPVWGEDEATKWIKEDKKVDVVAINSGGNARQKLNTMIVSDDLPDVIWMDRGADVENLRSNGLIVPFDDYLDKYPNLKKWAGESTINMLRSPDGKLYQFPNWYTSQPNGNAGYVVNKKSMKSLVRRL